MYVCPHRRSRSSAGFTLLYLHTYVLWMLRMLGTYNRAEQRRSRCRCATDSRAVRAVHGRGYLCIAVGTIAEAHNASVCIFYRSILEKPIEGRGWGGVGWAERGGGIVAPTLSPRATEKHSHRSMLLEREREINSGGWEYVYRSGRLDLSGFHAGLPSG